MKLEEKCMHKCSSYLSLVLEEAKWMSSAVGGLPQCTGRGRTLSLWISSFLEALSELCSMRRISIDEWQLSIDEWQLSSSWSAMRLLGVQGVFTKERMKKGNNNML